MARRKDHTPEQLQKLICDSAKNIIENKGLAGLTARSLAKKIGYTPGTIYNFYRDMDALVVDINFETLGRLYDFCQKKIENVPADFSRVKALAYAYVDFAHQNVRAWETVFATTYKGEKKVRLPKYYQGRLLKLFSLIESTLRECLQMPVPEVQATARLLWASLHGITVLTLDGRLNLIGSDNPHHMIDDLLQKYLARFL